jgi:hypothetical protein
LRKDPFRRILVVAVPVHKLTCRPSPSLARHSGSNSQSDRREPVISSVTGRQLGDLPNMIQPPLPGVVNAASAVSARTLTCRAPAVSRSWAMASSCGAARDGAVANEHRANSAEAVVEAAEQPGFPWLSRSIRQNWASRQAEARPPSFSRRGHATIQ